MQKYAKVSREKKNTSGRLPGAKSPFSGLHLQNPWEAQHEIPRQEKRNSQQPQHSDSSAGKPGDQVWNVLDLRTPKKENKLLLQVAESKGKRSAASVKFVLYIL